jgi:hypothetical protein
VTLKPQSHDERKTTNCNSENLVVLPGATKSLLFLHPRTRIGFGFPAGAACSQNLNI